jgi:outer membrane protein assembly factor BamB
MDKRRKIIRIILFLLFMLLFIVSANAADWPRWRGPNGDGISTETDWDPAALAKGPKILWKTNVGFGMSNVSIQGKYLYTLGSDLKNDTVFCLDAETGKEIWKYSYKYASAGLGQLGGYSPQATPTVDGDSVYSLSQAGHLCCLDARKGKVRWYKHLVEDYKVVRPFYGFAGSPVVEGDLLLINGNSYGIALEKKTGKPVWFSPPVDYREKGMNSTGSEYSTPIVYTLNSKRYAAMLSGYGLYSADVATG